MKFISILHHSNQGRCEYQEDSYASGNDFIPESDGVSGLVEGNIASDIVARTWKAPFDLRRIHLSSLEDDIKAIVRDTLSGLMSYAAENPDSSGMGATLACAAIMYGKIFSIHVGDSRIYHFSKDGESYEYAGNNDLNELGWYKGNSGYRAHHVRQNKSNGYGLYDMSGNVWEWTSSKDGSYRAYRGGSWSGMERNCLLSDRYSGSPAYRGNDLGFRLAVPL
jgi:hypothetical protein